MTMVSTLDGWMSSRVSHRPELASRGELLRVWSRPTILWRGGDLDHGAVGEALGLVVALGRLGEQHGALLGRADLLEVAVLAVPVAVGAGVGVLGDDDQFEVVERALVGEAHRSNVERGLVVQAPRGAALGVVAEAGQGELAEGVGDRPGLADDVVGLLRRQAGGGEREQREERRRGPRAWGRHRQATIAQAALADVGADVAKHTAIAAGRALPPPIVSPSFVVRGGAAARGGCGDAGL
ncbi:MAG: hypothetical protein IPG88_13110 [Gemmatimonadetes bacterium]|nr:hypothetical protein [Gemmatimonadota bacterium]